MLYLQNESGVIGSLGVGQRTRLNQVDYKLTLSDGTLSLRINEQDLTAPTISNVSADITTITNQDVTITADFEDNVELASKLYKIGSNGQWYDYTNGVTVYENTTVYFKAIDDSGNESGIASYTVSNIDKVAPNMPTASADKTSPTNTKVKVTATFSSDSVRKEYSLDYWTWQEYTQPIVFEHNGTVIFRGWDEAGNVSDEAWYEIMNIDKEAPYLEVYGDFWMPAHSCWAWLECFDESSYSLFYSTDEVNWTSCSNELTIYDNGTYYFKAVDAAGNTTTRSVDVSCIDWTPPAKPVIIADITAPTNQNVTLNVTNIDGDVMDIQYSVNGASWQSYWDWSWYGGLTFSENCTVFFQAWDMAGNTSEIASYTISNIDKVAPNKPTAYANTTSPTNQNVTVTASFSSDSVRREYSLDSWNWRDYTQAIAGRTAGR